MIAAEITTVATMTAIVAVATTVAGYGRGDYGRDDRWDGGRHNGYYYNNRWSYGPPPAAYYGRPGFRPGYTRGVAALICPATIVAAVMW
jgi:hypothetical protein